MMAEHHCPGASGDARAQPADRPGSTGKRHIFRAVARRAALAALTTGLIDYAGLFPPAALDMASAVAQYAAYRRGPPEQRALLGRFVVPVARLGELTEAAAQSLDQDVGRPWHLSALGGTEPDRDACAVRAFNTAMTGAAVVDVIETRATSPEGIAAAAGAHDPAALFLEIPSASDPGPLLACIGRVGAGAKIRTGGVVPEAIPSCADVARFLLACAEARVRFKATAGLHHALRSAHALTYEANGPTGMMHGFLNVFLAAALAHAGGGAADTVALVGETARDAIRFDDAGATWRSHHLRTEQLRDVRAHFAIAFGSCSFREPIEDLVALGLL